MRSFLAMLFLWSSFVFSCEDKQQDDSLLVVLLMVKNEETVMKETLKPFLQAGIDSYLILDTGSTDNTIAVTQGIFEEYSVQQGYIEEQPFVDFATSRNYAIKKAEDHFPNAQFFLMIDAEWYMYNVEGLLKFCKRHQHDSLLTYLITMYWNNAKSKFHQLRLFRPHKGVQFVGVVHEVLNHVATVQVPDDVYFVWRPTSRGITKSANRFMQDRDLLLHEQERNPDNPRTLFYLAQTYECLGDLENAAVWYKQRCKINGWVEENFMAHYRLACVYERLKDWDQSVLYYLKAFSVRPKRIEPLVKLAEHYWNNNNYELCYMYAYWAAKIKMPKDILFVEKEMYEYTRYEILGRVAWYVGEYDVGKNALLKALQVHPDDSHLHANLDWYMKRL